MDFLRMVFLYNNDVNMNGITATSVENFLYFILVTYIRKVSFYIGVRVIHEIYPGYTKEYVVY